MDPLFLQNILVLKQRINELKENYDVDCAAISSFDDFKNYEDIIDFKYKYISQKKQLSKVCDFLTENKLEYDWYIKIRPDITLLSSIQLSDYSENHINARARVYEGSKRIINGSSCGGIGFWSNVNDISNNLNKEYIVLDDQIYIFSKKIIESGAFLPIEPYTDEAEHEWIHKKVWDSRSVKYNVVGLNCIFTNNQNKTAHSGNINY